MNRSRHYLLLATLTGAALLSGCAVEPTVGTPAASQSPSGSTPARPGTPPPVAPVNVPPPAPVLSADQIALNEGIELYNKGQFSDAIKRLGSPEIAAGSVANQVAAMKYMAFGYCVTNRQTLCRQQFEKAFKLDPAFDLAQGEHGHPLWGKAFARAKTTANAPVKPK